MQKVFLADVLKAIKKAYIWNDEISQQILERAMMQLPPADDVTEEQVKQWCKQCCMTLMTNEYYSLLIRRITELEIKLERIDGRFNPGEKVGNWEI